jgi:hypothetical protein
MRPRILAFLKGDWKETTTENWPTNSANVDNIAKPRITFVWP